MITCCTHAILKSNRICQSKYVLDIEGHGVLADVRANNVLTTAGLHAQRTYAHIMFCTCASMHRAAKPVRQYFDVSRMHIGRHEAAAAAVSQRDSSHLQKQIDELGSSQTQQNKSELTIQADGRRTGF